MKKLSLLLLSLLILVLAGTFVACNSANCNHVIKKIDVVEATCENTGKTAGEYCLLCNKVFKKVKATPRAHTLDAEGYCTKCGRQEFLFELNEDGQSYAVAGPGRDFNPDGLFGVDSDEIIPNEFLGKPITKVKDGAFEGCDISANIVLPDSVTTIGARAFAGYERLKRIDLPSSVVSIGADAFLGSHYLYVYYDGDIEQWCHIEFGNAFANPNAESQTRLYIGKLYVKNPEFVRTDGFREPSIKQLTIPDSVTKINPYTFYNFEALRSVEIPATVESIGEDAFYGCSNLKTIYNRSELDIVAKSGDNGGIARQANAVHLLTEDDQIKRLANGLVIVDDSYDNIIMEYLGDSPTVEIPDYVTVIGAYAFAYSPYVTDVQIPHGVRMIEDYAFLGCDLSSIEIPSSVVWLGVGVFSTNEKLTSVTFAEGIKIDTIRWKLFSDCKKLKSIVIPSSVTTISSEAFRGCTLLYEVIFEDPYNWYIKNGSATKIEADLLDPYQNSIYLVEQYTMYSWGKN